MLISLIGMPASGKTQTGKKLAKKLNFDFVDLDEMIVEAEGEAISQIFLSKGEDYFRIVERQCLKEALKLNDVVIATGGGTPCFFDNMALINQNSLCIWLNVPLMILAERMMKSQSEHRPMYKSSTNEALLKKLTQTLNQRLEYYQKARMVIQA